MKKDPYKFTLHLNANDPRHVRAAEYLNSLGHKMGGTIVNALLFYMEKGAPTGASRAPALTRDQIRQLVYDILRRQRKVPVSKAGSMPDEKVGAVGVQNTVEAGVEEKAAEGMETIAAGTVAVLDGRGLDDGAGESGESKLDDDALRQIDDALKMFGDM